MKNGKFRRPVLGLICSALLLAGCSASEQKTEEKTSATQDPADTTSKVVYKNAGLVYENTDQPLEESQKTRKASSSSTVRRMLTKQGNTNLPSISSFPKQNPKKETLFVYMVGSDLESKYESQAATHDIQEMLASGFNNPDVNLVVYTGGANAWWNGLPADENCFLVYDPNGNNFSVYADQNKNMVQQDALTNALTTMQDKFPAEDYEVIFWDHGGGPLQGYGKDERYEPEKKLFNMLTLDEIGHAFDASGLGKKGLKWIGFDACLMGSMEITQAMAPYTDTLIASPELEPGSGWDYRFLSNYSPDAKPADFTKAIIDAYAESILENRSPRSNVRYSLIAYDLSGQDRLVQAVDALFGKINADVKKNPSALNSVLQAQMETWMYGYQSGMEMLDLAHFVNQLSGTYDTEKKAVFDALNAMVIKGRTNLENTGGMAMYLPIEEQKVYALIGADAVKAYQPSKEVSSYIANYADLVGNTKSEPIDFTRSQTPLTEEEDTVVTYTVPEELKGNIASASVELFMRNDKTGNYNLLVKDLPAEIGEDGTIAVDEDFEIPYAVGNGEASQLPSMYVQNAGNSRQMRTSVSALSTGEDYADNHGLPAIITYMYDPENGQTSFDSLRVVQNNEISVYSSMKADIDSEDYTGFRAYYPWSGKLSEEEKMKPYSNKENSGVWYTVFSVDDSFEVHTVPISQAAASPLSTLPDYSYQLNVKDYAGNEYTIAFEDLDSSSDLYTEKTDKGEMTFALQKDSAVLAEYSGEDQKLTVPDKVKGLPVTAAKRFVSETLEQVDLPDGITTLSSGAFTDAPKLKSIHLPASLDAVPASAFYGCTELKSIELPDGIRAIGKNAFIYCAIEKLEIPASVQAIHPLAFTSCDDLQSISFEKGSPFTLNGPMILDQDGTRVVCCISSLKDAWQKEKDPKRTKNNVLNEPVPLTYYCASVPEGVTEIGVGAFTNCSAGLFDNKDEGVLYRISFPSTLKKIGAYAFYNADIDLNLEFPESLESIGPFAFAEYNALSPEGQQGTVTFNKKLNHIGYAVFERNADLTFKLDEQNESFLLEDNQLYSSSGDQKIPLFRSEDDPEHEEH